MDPYIVYGQKVGQKTVKIPKKTEENHRLLGGYLCLIQKPIKILQFGFHNWNPDFFLHIGTYFGIFV